MSNPRWKKLVNNARKIVKRIPRLQKLKVEYSFESHHNGDTVDGSEDFAFLDDSVVDFRLQKETFYCSKVEVSTLEDTLKRIDGGNYDEVKPVFSNFTENDLKKLRDWFTQNKADFESFKETVKRNFVAVEAALAEIEDAHKGKR